MPRALEKPPLSDPPAPRRLWRRYLLDPIVTQLKQGITPEKIALSIVVGGSISLFPIIGTTTSLCVLAGIWLRLNHPIVQLVNYLAYPLQLVLLLVFIRIGESIFHAPRLPFSVSELTANLHASPLHFFREFAITLLYGSAAWLLIVPPIALIVYFALRPVVRRLKDKNSSAALSRPPNQAR